MCERFGFFVPHSCHSFVEPEDPWNAFTGLGMFLEESPSPQHGDPGIPAELNLFAWTGIDDGHFAFVVDEEPGRLQEFPIAVVRPGESMYLRGMNFAEFLTLLFAEEEQSLAAGKIRIQTRRAVENAR